MLPLLPSGALQAAVHTKDKSLKCSPAACSQRRLHGLLELQEGRVRRGSIAGVHLGHHVGADVLAKIEAGEGVVNVHGLGLAGGRNHVADRRIDGRVVGQRRHALGVDAADGLVVSVRTRLQRRPVHGGPHHDHLVDGLEDRVPARSRELGVNVGGPVDLLQEGVGRLRQLLGRIIDLVSMSCGRAQHGKHASRCGHGSHTASGRRHERGVAKAREDHQGHDEHRASLAVRHGVCWGAEARQRDDTGGEAFKLAAFA